MVWKPRFKVGDCVKWGKYNELCIKKIKIEGEGGTYDFVSDTKQRGTYWGPSIDDGVEINNDIIAKAVKIKKTKKPTKTKKNGGRKVRRSVKRRNMNH